MKTLPNLQKIKKSTWLVGLTLSTLGVVSCSKEESFDATSLGDTTNKSFATPTDNGVYFIVNKNSGRYMDIAEGSNSTGANLQQWDTAATATQTHRQWEVDDLGNGYVRLKGVDSGKSLEVALGSNSSGANVEQASYAGETHQQWELIPTDSGYYRIKGLDSGKTIGVANSGTENGDNIEIASWNGDDTFQWLFIPVNGDVTSEEPTVEVPSSGYDLDASKFPAENFDLSQWKITVSSGDDYSVKDLNDNFEFENQFYTGSDGGMVFKNYPAAAGTTKNSTYSRVELREMLRGTNDDIDTKGINGNNWVFGSSSSSNQEKAGGVGGVLTATLAVNRVTTTSESDNQMGIIVIGQIHASDNEPIRLYYKQMPGDSKGAIYFLHEDSDSKEIAVNIIGDYAVESGDKAGDYTGASEPSNGIPFGEIFSYKIEVIGTMLYVDIYRDGAEDASGEYDMKDSGFADDWMYFKAGIYSQNKSVQDEDDYEQVTFYALGNTH